MSGYFVDCRDVEVRDRYGDYGQRFHMRVVYPLLEAKEEVEAEEPS